MYSAHNKAESVVAKRFISKLNTKIYKYMTLLSKDMYIDILDEIVVKYNNTYENEQPNENKPW